MAKTLRNLRNENLAKLRIAKPCETRICKTLRILRNKRQSAKKIIRETLRSLYLQTLRNTTVTQQFAKLGETKIAKIAQVAKIE